MTATLKTEDAGPRTVSRSVQVGAPVAEIFAMIVDPHRHPEFDGSGTVRDLADFAVKAQTGSARATNPRSG